MAIKQELEKKTKRTCLFDKHLSLGAMMVEFGGGIIETVQFFGIGSETVGIAL